MVRVRSGGRLPGGIHVQAVPERLEGADHQIELDARLSVSTSEIH
jgi:hypothetical protein